MCLPKLLIVGHGRHGKDTVCDILKNKYNFSFESSSKFCSQLFIFDQLKHKYNYSTEHECYADRHNHRTEWYNMIHDYCRDDLARLGKDIFAAHDIYCGLRNRREFHAMRNQGVFDYCIWVDRSDHLPAEDYSSMSIEPWMSDFVIDNNAGLDRLEKNTDDLILALLKDF